MPSNGFGYNSDWALMNTWEGLAQRRRGAEIVDDREGERHFMEPSNQKDAQNTLIICHGGSSSGATSAET